MAVLSLIHFVMESIARKQESKAMEMQSFSDWSLWTAVACQGLSCFRANQCPGSAVFPKGQLSSGQAQDISVWRPLPGQQAVKCASIPERGGTARIWVRKPRPWLGGTRLPAPSPRMWKKSDIWSPIQQVQHFMFFLCPRKYSDLEIQHFTLDNNQNAMQP